MKYTKDFEKYWSKVMFEFSFRDGSEEQFKLVAFRAWKAGIKHYRKMEDNPWLFSYPCNRRKNA
jgi:hypothetical protein